MSVDKICVWDMFIDDNTNNETDIAFGFRLQDSYSDDMISSLLSTFQQRINNSNGSYTLDYSGEQDPNTNKWDLGFCPCNLTDDDGETLSGAIDKVKDLTEQLRLFMMFNGINCGDIVNV
jgi:hypothetical protein